MSEDRPLAKIAADALDDLAENLRDGGTQPSARILVQNAAMLLRTLLAENARLQAQRDATNALMSARGTNRDYWESVAKKLQAENARLRERLKELAAEVEGWRTRYNYSNGSPEVKP